MQVDSNVIRIGSSPMTPTQLLMGLWAKINEGCPDIKFQIVPFKNTPENAREILGNFGNHIDVIAGIFAETMLDLRSCAGLELSREPFCCAVSIRRGSIRPLRPERWGHRTQGEPGSLCAGWCGSPGGLHPGGMSVASSQYWNMVYGGCAEDVSQDAEGLQTMRPLGRNMAFMMKSFQLGWEPFGLPTKEAPIFTNFHR